MSRSGCSKALTYSYLGFGELDIHTKRVDLELTDLEFAIFYSIFELKRDSVDIV